MADTSRSIQILDSANQKVFPLVKFSDIGVINNSTDRFQKGGFITPQGTKDNMSVVTSVEYNDTDNKVDVKYGNILNVLAGKGGTSGGSTGGSGDALADLIVKKVKEALAKEKQNVTNPNTTNPNSDNAMLEIIAAYIKAHKSDLGIPDSSDVDDIITKSDKFIYNSKGMSSGSQTVGTSLTAAAFYESSDERLKNITETFDGEELTKRLKALTPFKFTWNETAHKLKEFDYSPNETNIGLSAQSVEGVFPELVHTNEKTGYLTVDYAKLTAVLIGVVNHLSDEIESLKSVKE